MSGSARPSVAFYRWLAAPALALAVLLALGVANRGAEWAVATHTGGGVLLADDRPVPLDDADRLRRAFRTSRHLRTDDSTRVTLRLGDLLSLDMDPGSRIGTPPTPGRLVDNEISLSVVDGTLRVLEGPDFKGSRRLVLFTPEARMEIRGPLVSVHRSGGETRVDVYEGEVRVGSTAPGNPLVVPAGRSARVVPGQPPEPLGSMDAAERRRLGQIRGRGFP